MFTRTHIDISSETNSKISMNEISFIMDVQGFYIKNKFYPREVAIVNSKYITHFLIDIPYISNLTDQDKSTIAFAKSLHGFELCSDEMPALPYFTFNSIMKHLYKKVARYNGKPVLVKNNQLQILLQEINIPTMVYEENIDYSTVENLDCLYHSNCRCALKKAKAIYNDISQNKA